MPIYIKIEGIDGDVTQAKYKGWIDCESLQWGVGRAVMTPVGSTMNREASAPTLSELTFTKTMDRSTATILQETCSGEAGKKVTVEMMTTANPPKTYMKYELEDALLSGYSCSGASGGGRPNTARHGRKRTRRRAGRGRCHGSSRRWKTAVRPSRSRSSGRPVDNQS